MAIFKILILTEENDRNIDYTLHSLMYQSHRDFTVSIISKNQSEFLNRLKSKYKGLDIVLKNCNGNDIRFKEMNTVANTLDYDYFTVIESGDVWIPNMLSIISELSEKHTNTDLFFPGYSKFDLFETAPITPEKDLMQFTGRYTIDNPLLILKSIYANEGIGNPIHKSTFNCNFSSIFFSWQIIEKAVKRQGEIFIDPFSDIGLWGCFFNTDKVFNINLPLTVIGKYHNKGIESLKSKPRSFWKEKFGNYKYSPIKGASFVNSRADLLLQLQKIYDPERRIDSELSFDFFVNHLTEISKDKPWMESTYTDYYEALPKSAENIMRNPASMELIMNNLQISKKEDIRIPDVMEFLMKYILQIQVQSNILDYATWMEHFYVLPKQKLIS